MGGGGRGLEDGGAWGFIFLDEETRVTEKSTKDDYKERKGTKGGPGLSCSKGE